MGSVVEPVTMMLPLACVADRLVMEADMVLLLVEPDTLMLLLALGLHLIPF